MTSTLPILYITQIKFRSTPTDLYIELRQVKNVVYKRIESTIIVSGREMSDSFESTAFEILPFSTAFDAISF